MASDLDKRERILRAAAELIVKNGLQSPMSAIAARADVAMGSIYNYFASKDDLILGVYASLAEAFNEKVVPEAIDRSVPHRARIMKYITDYIDFFWADWDRAILFEYLSNVPLIPPDALAEVFARTRAYSRTLLEEAQADGVLRPCSVQLMGGLIGGGIRNTLKWHRMSHTELGREERDEIAEMCWSAIAAEPSARA
ncbi:transcriptional regulator, TetR family [Devosia enhydra]|uniref:Transcriptional regulator, TetR family n=1 Tax=Devosia enhydra TaxID=665118 RepID=A0A1K2HZJ8_9HYPH|nr:TetR/AcrR family transcriptional regulator [Devosia enhydra]SFZ85504.1 transcriptional regulator, TetR family [Devosia enhydra]